MRLRRGGRVSVGDAGLGGDPVHDPLVPVGLVDRHDVLEDRSTALEPEARVDVLLRKGSQGPIGVLLVGHEDEVPELEEPCAARAGRRAIGLAAAVLLAPVVVQLGVRAARPGAAHRPEVLGGRQRHDPLDGHAHALPELDRHLVGAELQLRIAGMNGHPDPIPVEPHVLQDELPGELDRALLEVLPEREVAEHLEERQVVAVEADLVNVRRAEGFLRGRQQRRGWHLQAQEVRHHRLHPGAREQRRSVFGPRDEGGRRHAFVALRLEEREIPLAQLCARPHGVDCRPDARAGRRRRLRRPGRAHAGLRHPAPSPSRRRDSGWTGTTRCRCARPQSAR